MTEKEARKLKVGDHVVFSDGVQGIVEHVGCNGAQFKWDDGQVGVIHNDDMQDVSCVGAVLRQLRPADRDAED